MILLIKEDWRVADNCTSTEATTHSYTLKTYEIPRIEYTERRRFNIQYASNPKTNGISETSSILCAVNAVAHFFLNPQ